MAEAQTVDKQVRALEAIKNPHAVTRELNNRSLYRFLRWAWPEIASQPYIENWHIPYLCKELEEVAEGVGYRRKKKHDLLINVPPGSTKTILCSIIFPVWCWTRWYWMRFITASYSSTLSLESAEYARDLIKSTRFQEVYPDLTIKLDKDTKSNYKIVRLVDGHNIKGTPRQKLGGNRYSTSVGGTLTGFHADIIIWDDPLNPMQAASEKEVMSANRWIDQTLPTRKTNKNISVTIGIMQRLHEDDPTGHILKKKKKNIKHFCFPGEIHGYEKQVRPKSCLKYYKDGLMDPNRMPLDTLKELEVDLGMYGYAGQIGQSPAPAGGGRFKVDMLQQTSELYSKNDIDRVVRYWDKAGSEGEGAYTVGVKMARLKNGFFVIEDVRRGQWSTERREKVIKSTAMADGSDCSIVVEQEPGSGGKESAENTIRNLAGYKVHADRPTGNKELRADPYSVQVNNGNVILRNAPWNDVYKKELELFPNGKYKDQIDASSGAFNFLVKKKKARRLT